LPVAAQTAVERWYKQQQRPGDKELDQLRAAPAAAEDAMGKGAASAHAEAIANMKYFALDGQLAARVCAASNSSQVHALLALSDEEMKAVFHRRSMLLAARSGTGRWRSDMARFLGNICRDLFCVFSVLLGRHRLLLGVYGNHMVLCILSVTNDIFEKDQNSAPLPACGVLLDNALLIISYSSQAEAEKMLLQDNIIACILLFAI
jgi:hypothetical protein